MAFALIGVAPGTAAATAAGSATHVKRVSGFGLQGAPAVVLDRVFRGSRLLSGGALPTRWGGATVSRTGEAVKVEFSDAYPVDPAAQQRMADFVTSLYHGSELALATFYFAPLAEIAELCGAKEAEGCYFSSEGFIVAPGEDVPNGPSVETIVAHELGHHIAAHRDNAPWDGLSWGPKRWSSYESICSRQEVGTAFPGNETDHYGLNPGEGWAETYRLLNYERLAGPGWVPAPWNADQSFYPDSGAFAAAKQDVLAPWSTPTATTWVSAIGPQAVNRPPRLRKKRHLAAAAPFRVVRGLATPRDGVLTIVLKRAPTGATVSLSRPDGSSVVAARPGSLTYTVCGDRTLRLTVTSPVAGEFTASITTP